MSAEDSLPSNTSSINMIAFPISRRVHATCCGSSQRSLPFVVIHAPIGSATSPVTMAGTMALANTESLAGITLCELISEGTPVVYGGAITGSNMRAEEKGNSMKSWKKHTKNRPIFFERRFPDDTSRHYRSGTIASEAGSQQRALSSLLSPSRPLGICALPRPYYSAPCLPWPF